MLDRVLEVYWDIWSGWWSIKETFRWHGLYMSIDEFPEHISCRFWRKLSLNRGS
jgi:hypothetical protein